MTSLVIILSQDRKGEHLFRIINFLVYEKNLSIQFHSDIKQVQVKRKYERIFFFSNEDLHDFAMTFKCRTIEIPLDFTTTKRFIKVNDPLCKIE